MKKLHNIIKTFIFIIMIYLLFYWLDQSTIKLTDKKYLNFILKETYNNKIIENKIKINKLLLFNEHFIKSNIIETSNSNKDPPKNDDTKLIYLYNSHQTEGYASSNFIEETITPTVIFIDYILKDEFSKKGYNSLIEEDSIKEILNKNRWKYYYSYKASRILMEQRKKEHPTLKYFIDIHRDSLTKNRTTVEINNKKYAKLLFIVGLENPNYQQNLKFTEEINTLLNSKYPNLSKGIYKKGGSGVNGVYNQDFSPYTILIEVGGYENTTTEVLNSALAFAECFMEVIKIYENN